MTVLASSLGPKAFPEDTRKKIGLPIAFSTLGCPTWEWQKILDFARQHRFAAIELRGLQGNLDLPSNPIFASDRIEQTKREIRESQLKIACVSSSANLYFADQEKRSKELGDARRFIDLASSLGAPVRARFWREGRVRSQPPPGSGDEGSSGCRVARAGKLCRTAPSKGAHRIP
jgi:sugar phosphate isomerase/epimerase